MVNPIDIMNDGANFICDEMGVDVIPAHTRNKRPIVECKRFENDVVTEEPNQQWTNGNMFDKGIAMFCGVVRHNKRKKGIYLNCIDLDNEPTIRRFCNIKGVPHTLEYWTTSYFQDQFSLDLTKVTNEIRILDDKGVTEKVIHYKKYYRQAISKMHRIPLTQQHPKTKEEAVTFNIQLSDLSPTVQEEFLDYCKLYDKRHVTIFLKQAVIRLFENLDYDYVHLSIMKKLRVSVFE